MDGQPVYLKGYGMHRKSALEEAISPGDKLAWHFRQRAWERALLFV
jgi:hypothetical protein